MATYNGHKNWNHWNVSLWLNNEDPAVWREMVHFTQYAKNRTEAAKMMLAWLKEFKGTHTPDGAPYSVTTIKAAMRGI